MPSANFQATRYGLWNNNFDGSTNITPPRSGMYLRSGANGYVYETLCEFDLSSLNGYTIDSAYSILDEYDRFRDQNEIIRDFIKRHFLILEKL